MYNGGDGLRKQGRLSTAPYTFKSTILRGETTLADYVSQAPVSSAPQSNTLSTMGCATVATVSYQDHTTASLQSNTPVYPTTSAGSYFPTTSAGSSYSATSVPPSAICPVMYPIAGTNVGVTFAAPYTFNPTILRGETTSGNNVSQATVSSTPQSKTLSTIGVAPVATVSYTTTSAGSSYPATSAGSSYPTTSAVSSCTTTSASSSYPATAVPPSPINPVHPIVGTNVNARYATIDAAYGRLAAAYLRLAVVYDRIDDAFEAAEYRWDHRPNPTRVDNAFNSVDNAQLAVDKAYADIKAAKALLV